jgi:UDP-GlcNAc:undecaprenyl-phosphate GlcNAc-1-phosphate transferase
LLPKAILFPMLVPAAAALATFALLALALRSQRALPLDHPNERSLHAEPVPRIGGVAIFAAVIPALVLLAWQPLVTALAAALALVSFVDDRRGLPIALRFSVHAIAAAVFVLSQLSDLPVAAQLALILAVIWLANLYNFMDGADGLAGGMALVGFGAYAVAAGLHADNVLAAAAATLALCAGAFLVFNFHPAKVFMGDAGAVPYGFLAAAIGLTGWRADYWPLWFPLLVFSPFIVDASATLARRLLRGERFWEAHRSHYYQRLVQLGWGHRTTAIAELALMILCALVALYASSASQQTQMLALSAAALVYLALALAVDRAWKLHERAL